jgi:hypothetical protein
MCFLVDEHQLKYNRIRFITDYIHMLCRSTDYCQWPRGLRRGFEVACLLGL